MTATVETAVSGIDRVQAPPVGGLAELANGIVWIRLPIPGGPLTVNVWLVPTHDGWFLVDTGMKTAAVAEAWAALDGSLPLSPGIEAIVVTHHHPDHYGMASWLAEKYGVPVYMSPGASRAAHAAIARRRAGGDPAAAGFAERSGFDLTPDIQSIFDGAAFGAVVSGEIDTIPLGEGETLPVGKANWRVSVHNGHAPAHVCLYDDGSGVMISGDQVLPAISSNISLFPGNEQSDPLGEYLDSLDRLERLPAGTLVLPAHGRPFATLHERIAALRREHGQRLDAIAQACREPLTTRAVTERLFPIEKMDTLNRTLALTETLAHLRRLEIIGVLNRGGSGPALRWQRN